MGDRKTARVLVIAVQILVILSPTAVFLGEARHPDDLAEIAERSWYTYSRLIQWLNSTGIASSLGINLSNFEDILAKSPQILEEVYSNATLAMFTGGLHLRQIKVFARASSDIESDDVINLLKTVATGLNISKIHLGCRDPMSKVFVNLAYPGKCRYSISDIDSVLYYAVVLGRRLPQEHLASVLSKVYAIRIALQVGEIGRDALDRVLSDLLYEDSIALYIILSNAIETSGVRVIQPHTQTTTVTLSAIPSDNAYTETSTSSTITLADIEKALDIVAELISLAKRHGVEVSAGDVIKIVSYVMGLDVERAVLAIRSIDLEDIRRLEEIVSAVSREKVEVSVGDILDIGGEGLFGVPMLNVTIPLFGVNSTSMGIGVLLHLYSSEIASESVDTPETAIEIERYIDSKRTIITSALAPALDRVNTQNTPLARSWVSARASHSVMYASQPKTALRADHSVSEGGLTIYLALLIPAFIGAVVMLRPRWILSAFARIAGVFRHRGGVVLRRTQSNRGSFLELFWVLVNRLALRLGVEISYSDTHREVYGKIVPRIEDGRSRSKLRGVVEGYEVLRYSNKPTIDEHLWLRSVRELLDEHG